MKYEIGDRVRVIAEGVIDKIDNTYSDNKVRYTVNCGHINHATMFETQLSAPLFECELCGREFTKDQFRTLIMATSPDGDKASACQECYDHEMSKPEPDEE